MRRSPLLTILACSTMLVGLLEAQAATTDPQPVRDPRHGRALRSISRGPEHGCGVAFDGTAYCWGRNEYGQLGSGPTSGAERGPTPVAGGYAFTQVSASSAHSCGVTTGGEVYCWGLNLDGQLGNRARESCQGVPCSSRPVRVASSLRFDQVTVGFSHSCATSNGYAWCWGRADRGTLGSDAANYCLGVPCSFNPLPVAGGHRFRSISAGGEHTCGVSGATVYCWGDNSDGQLGVALIAWSSRPVAARTGERFMSVVASGRRTCAASPGGRTCWGGTDASVAAAARSSPQ